MMSPSDAQLQALHEALQALGRGTDVQQASRWLQVRNIVVFRPVRRMHAPPDGKITILLVL
jgi:hypothetical protein